MQEAYNGLPNDKFLRWIGYRGLDVLITNSRATAGEIEQYALTTARVHIVPNGVHVPAPFSSIERSRLKSELAYSETDLVIGSIGRLDANKNYSMLLRVFATLHEKWEMSRLLIIGEGPLKSQLLEMAKQLGVASKVRFPGAIPLAARYLPAMEICCLTSYTEGVPNVVMEAASAGLPVISTRCGDTAYLIEEHISGYLVSPDDDVTMSKYLDQLLSNPEQRFRMGQAGQEKMRREFSIGSMVKRTTLLYEELLSEKRLSVA
jgi:glycosyltransferase involved in cell wall biosynthesis